MEMPNEARKWEQREKDNKVDEDDEKKKSKKQKKKKHQNCNGGVHHPPNRTAEETPPKRSCGSPLYKSRLFHKPHQKPNKLFIRQFFPFDIEFRTAKMALRFTFVILGFVALAKAQEGYPRENPADRFGYNYNGDDEGSVSGGEIPGEPGKDYPVLAEVPETRFACDQQQFPGYYADPEAQCQVFHICQSGGRKDSFLCPNGTIFSQEKLVCDWWYNFDCAQAQSLYSINEAIVRAMEEADRLAAEKKAAEGYRYSSPSSDGLRTEQQKQPQGPSSDFDSVVVEAARTAANRAQVPQAQRPVYDRPEVLRRQPTQAYTESSQITGAIFEPQPNAPRDTGALVREPSSKYLPAQFQAGQY
ncbi:uncharacterized protein [Neodiprion pinetum]|uniref:uncharacterized protein n=1 Tax=Neodiprion pinetum TaxID=441929 RepID=UPI0037176CC8